MPYKDPERRRQYLRDRRKDPEWKEYYRGLESKRRVKFRKIISEAKAGPCLDCGSAFHHCAMDFDHRDPTSKRFGISDNLCRNVKDLLDEIAKCDLVCSNCHRLREWKRSHQT